MIDQALAPLNAALAATDPDRLAQLKRDLAAVVSAEAFFSLTDLAGLSPDEAIASLVRTATTITEVALGSPCAGVGVDNGGSPDEQASLPGLKGLRQKSKSSAAANATFV